MRDIIILLATGQPIDENRIESCLLDVCIDTHESCNDDCPVFFLNKSSIPTKDGRCSCMLNGNKMAKFIRESTGQVAPVPSEPKKKKVVPTEHIERFARFKSAVAGRFLKLGIEGKPKFLSMQKPLTPSQFVKIIDDYSINDFVERRTALLDVVVGMQNPSKKLGPDANLTIRRWMNWRLKIESHEDLERKLPVEQSGEVKVIVVSDTESLLKQAQRLKQQKEQ